MSGDIDNNGGNGGDGPAHAIRKPTPLEKPAKPDHPPPLPLQTSQQHQQLQQQQQQHPRLSQPVRRRPDSISSELEIKREECELDAAIAEEAAAAAVAAAAASPVSSGAREACGAHCRKLKQVKFLRLILEQDKEVILKYPLQALVRY